MEAVILMSGMTLFAFVLYFFVMYDDKRERKQKEKESKTPMS